jgi:hypothetical protein
MGSGVAIGFMSHLVLDEIYAVEWHGARVRLNKFAGSAVKFFGQSWGANIWTYGLLFTISYAILVDNGLINPGPMPPGTNLLQQADQVDRIERIDLRRR